MSRPVVLTEEARRDFDAAADWYEREAGLGDAFPDEVLATLGRVGTMPEAPAVLFRGVRRLAVRRCPYQVIYRVAADRIEVVAVMHNRRDASAWKRGV